ncbi:MAG: glycosyltransferase [bacterium]|nr:glycosyltransferase [bacterium]
MDTKPLTYKDRPLRIVFAADARNVHTHKWVRYFLDRGCEIKVISFREWEIPGAEVYVHSIPPTGIASIPPFRQIYTASDYSHVRSILKWADIVNVQFIYRFRFNMVYKGLPRLVVSTWGSDILGVFGQEETKEEAHWKKYILDQATELVALSKFLAGAMRKYLSKERKIHIIPFSVDMEKFDPAKYPRKPANEEVFRIGFVKGLKKIYGPDVLIEATRVLRDRGYNIRTILAGDGEDLEELRTLARERGVHHLVDFLGYVPNDEVPSFLASLDVSCMPSRSESLGVAALESQAMEIPVVASRTGGIPEAVLDGLTGILVTPGDPVALADGIASLLDNPAKRQEMGKAGRRFVRERFDFQINAGKLAELFEGLLKTN